MAPRDKTSLSIEFLTLRVISLLTNDEVIDLVKKTLIKEKLFKNSDVLNKRLIDIKMLIQSLKLRKKYWGTFQSFSNQSL